MHIYQSIDEKKTAELIRNTGNADALALLAKRKIKAAAKVAGVEVIFHKLWRYQLIDHKGHKRTFTGAPTEAKTKDMAETRRVRIREIREGIRPAPKASDTPRDFAETAGEYVAWGKASGGRRGFGWSPSHVKQRKAALDWWQKRLSLETLQDIDLASVEKVLRELSKTRKPKTVQNCSEALKAFGLWCVKRHFLDADPLDGLEQMDTTPETPHRPLSVAEVQGIMGKAPPERQLLYKVALATGYRMNELRQLTVANLDPFGPALTLPPKATKNRKGARQFITPALAAELTKAAEGKAKTAPLVHVPEKHTCRENFYRDAKRAGIPKVKGDGLTFHSLRVTFIQTIVEAGADVKTAMEAARHGSAAMTFERYAKPNPDRLRKLAETAEKALSEPRTGIAVAQREATNDSATAQPIDTPTPCKPESWYALQDLNLSERQNQGVESTEGKPALQAQVGTDNEESAKENALSVSPVGTVENARKHSSGIVGAQRNLPADLQELADLWARLPEAVRAGLLTTARAVAGDRDSLHASERTRGGECEDSGA